MNRIALLDVNVLVALFLERHVHHDVVHGWFEDHAAGGWATCPLTENGLFRILSQPHVSGTPRRPVDVAGMLRTLCEHTGHHFWPDAISLCDQAHFEMALVRGHKQITDTYLLGLAAEHGAVFATFDRGIHQGAARNASADSLYVISAAPEESTSVDK